MVFQLAMPVHNKIIAPIAIAITLVSPIDPGMVPMIISLKDVFIGWQALTNPKGVAAVNPSGNVFPKPQIAF